MKKILRTLLVLMLVLVMQGSALAQEYYTLPEIREQAAQGWHETYTDKYGRTREVDIDIEAYGGDTAPVLKGSWGDNPEVRFWYGEKEWGPLDDISQSEKKHKGERFYLYEDVPGMKVDIDHKYGADHGNDLTLREAYAFMTEKLHERGIDQDYLWEQPSNFTVVYSQHKKTGELLVPASYYVRLWPVEYGLPVLTHVCLSFRKGLDEPTEDPQLFIQFRDNESYYGCVFDWTVEEILAEDIPLCSMEKVLESAQSMIEAGFVKEVLSLRFGYTVYTDPNYKWNARDTAYDIPTQYLVPSWVMQCYILPNPKVDDLKGHDMVWEITINAQTGEAMDYYDTSLRGRGDGRYKGFIPWEDVQ